MEKAREAIEYIEIDSVEYYKKKLQKWAIAVLLLSCVIPLIIYDSMGYADYFKLNSGVTLDDNKKLRFVFGWLYFLSRMPIRGFLPWNLFCGLGRLVCGVGADNGMSLLLAVLYTAAFAYMYLGTATSFVLTIIRIDGKEKAQRTMFHALFIGYTICAALFMTVIVTLSVKISSAAIRLDDFLAYGFVKFAVELVFSIVLGLLCFKLYREIKNDKR